MLTRTLALLALLYPCFAPANPVSTPHVTAELVLENKSASAGQTTWLGLLLEMKPHWHTYWRFPGDSGLPTEVKWTLPAGWKVGEALWPLPKRILLPPLLNFGHEGEALLAFPLEVPAGTPEGTHELRASASWLVCKEECIPEKVELVLRVRVAGGRAQAGSHAAKFAKLRAEQPQPPPATLKLSAVEKGALLGIEVDGLGEGPGKLDFLPLVPQLVKGTAPVKVEKRGTVRTLWMEKAEPYDGTAIVLPGVLLAGGDLIYEVRVPLAPAAPSLPDSPVAAVGAAGGESAGLGLSLLFAFLGGLVLNLMPCVFPVLGIKVMSLVRQGGKDRGHVRAHGHAYALGVLLSFVCLGGILLLVRSAGEAAGWGFQLQRPGFVTLLVLLFSFVAADLAGFVQWSGRWMGAGSSLAQRDGWSGSFFTGMLAVLVATPCTAPFMGTAMGAVIAEPAPVVLAVFAALGLGLALPFVFLCYQPALLARLPKPGPWMERLKELFALPMAATVLWLLWVLSMQVGADGVLKVQLGLLLLGGALWAGRRFRSGTGRMLELALLLAGFACAAWGAGSPQAATAAEAKGAWKAFRQEAVDEAVKAGKPVFVDFTAAWCITCQVNKKLVLDRPAMQAYFREKGVELFLADWTNRDPLITRALEAHGRIGVPLYLAYRPGEGKPELLPQLLTEERMREAFP